MSLTLDFFIYLFFFLSLSVQDSCSVDDEDGAAGDEAEAKLRLTV